MAILFLLFMLVRAGVVDGANKTCGCVWSQHGCSISSKLLVQELGSLEHVQAYCGHTTSAAPSAAFEGGCAVRKYIASKAGEVKRCLSLEALQCSQEPLCQWSAQEMGRCGIDEEGLVLKFVTELMGQGPRQLPLMHLIMLGDHCSKHTEEFCDPDPYCSWNPASSYSQCDIKETTVVQYMMIGPTLIQDMKSLDERINCDSVNAAVAPHPKGQNPKCLSPCMAQDGVCSYPDNDAELGLNPMGQLEEVLSLACFPTTEARRLAETAEEKCLSPCVGSNHGCKLHLTSGVMKLLGTGTAERQKLLKVLSIVMSSTAAAASSCQQRSSAEECQAVDLCNAELRGVPPFVTGWLGVKGVLQRAARAVVAGEASSFLGAVLEKNPSSFKVLRDQASKTLHSLISAEENGADVAGKEKSPSTSDEEFDDEEEDEQKSELTTSVQKHMDPGQVEDEEHKESIDETSEAIFQLPGGLLGACLVAIVFASVLPLVIMCHSRMFRVRHVREPLLGTSAPGMMDLGQDQELESAPFPTR